MTEYELVARTMTNLVDGEELDDLSVAVIAAAISAIIAWLVRRCLDATLDVEKLDRLVRWGCKIAARSDAADQLGMNAKAIHAAFGDRMANAIIKTQKGLRYRELQALRQRFPQRASTRELPEDA
jgi:uncharacterized hydantoinase/oxoprolinase family protein